MRADIRNSVLIARGNFNVIETINYIIHNASAKPPIYFGRRGEFG